MRRSSAREAQTEPLAALAAVAVVGIALALYAGAFEDAVPDAADRNVAQDAADRVERAVSDGGVVRPVRMLRGRNAAGPWTGRNGPNTSALAPDGYRLNVTLVVDGETTAVGPAAPAVADAASRRVSVRVGPGKVRPGRLEVRVWA